MGRDKIQLIKNNKEKFNLLINNLLIDMSNNFNLIKENYKTHNNFINFTEIIKLYEKYKWNIIKEEYNNIRKKITCIINSNKNIIKLYGTINNYYSKEEHDKFNKLFQKISDDILLLKIEMNNLRNIHLILINKKKSYINNNNIIKINTLQNDYIIYINKLYNIYDNIIKLNKEVKILKNEKKLI